MGKRGAFWTEEKLAKIKDLHARKVTCEAIGGLINISGHSVWLKLREMKATEASEIGRAALDRKRAGA